MSGPGALMRGIGEAVHFVMEGKVKIYKPRRTAGNILYIAVPGDIFAEVILFNEVNYPATAEVWKRPELPLFAMKT